MTKRHLLFAFLVSTWITPAVAHDEPGAHHSSIPGVRAEILTKADRSWNGSLLPPYPEAQPQVTIIRYQFAPGAVLPVHKHPVINAGVLLRGQLEVKTTAGQTLGLKAGDPIVELVNQWHEGHNPGEETAELIVFYAGTPNLPLVIRPTSPPVSTPPSDSMNSPITLAGSVVPFISGGVGEESMAAITAREKLYDLKLLLVGQSGSYLSDVRITITDQSGTGVLMTTSEGPVLLANLPNGTYRIKAQKNGQTLEQIASIRRGKLNTIIMRFNNE
jgi:quercetin dioxygenase-like cupin family protein